jgi:phosphatidylserine/phosphatidylglycerophosphate/cardiolipin synthase-like enzyme
MLSLSSTSVLLGRLRTAREISVEAYTLHGPVLRAIEAAARRGANVKVELEGHPFNDRKGGLAKENERLAHELAAAGADAWLADRVHAKEIEVDGTVFLDEKNWRTDDIVLCEDDPAEARSIPMMKDEALAQEAKLLDAGSRLDRVIVESESFGSGNVTFEALKALGEARASPRLLVSERDLRGSRRERAVLQNLVRSGVEVRLCKDSKKLAVAGNSAWLGSANATYAGEGFDMTDWGVRTDDATIVKTVRDSLEAQWESAKPFRGRRA